MNEKAPLSVGMVVRHPKRPEWGPGEILSIEGDTVRVRFRDVPALDGPTKSLNLQYVDLQPEPDTPASPYAVTFPKVIRFALNWRGNLTPEDYQRVDIPDARDII